VKHYTATDLSELLPLITKNMSLNASNGLRDNTRITELNWLNLPPAPRLPMPPDTGLGGCPGYDLILALDTIYHPALLPAFVNTLDALAIPGQTAALVGVELRAEEVAREFLDRWCHLEGWTVSRLGEDEWSLPFVFWLGHKQL
jgi:protein N-lysine methyltransferase METTL21D